MINTINRKENQNKENKTYFNAFISKILSLQNRKENQTKMNITKKKVTNAYKHVK